MNNREAIEQLKIARCAFTSRKMKAAFEMAIAALEESPVENIAGFDMAELDRKWESIMEGMRK